jgi:YebC/PmpR family DNA-binding regulatory protein
MSAVCFNLPSAHGAAVQGVVDRLDDTVTLTDAAAGGASQEDGRACLYSTVAAALDCRASATMVPTGSIGPHQTHNPLSTRTPMGRIFETRKHTMFARWDRMAKQFTRIGKDIVIAVKAGGPDPAANPQLRRVIQNARAVNMPKDKVEAAIKRAAGKDASDYEEILYEGYAPHGVAILVEAATDNPTRTVSNLRNHFNKGGGNLGSSGSVSFLFKRMGVFRLDPAGIEPDELELDLIDHGLEEMGESTGEKGELQLVVRCAFADFGHLQKALEDRGIKPLSAESEYLPVSPVDLVEDKAKDALKLVDTLEQDDDVQKVFHNLS